MKLIGLTGGIASGKSTAGRMLARIGIPVVDADLLAREAVEPGSPGLAALVARFGTEILDADGSLDRKKLGNMVFTNDEALQALNAIVHPEVARLADERLQAFRRGGVVQFCVYEVPLLFENGLDGMMDATILVATPEAEQLKRLMARDGLDAEQARARIRAQLSQDEKRKRATVVVENDGSLDTLAQRLEAAWFKITGQKVYLTP